MTAHLRKRSILSISLAILTICLASAYIHKNSSTCESSIGYTCFEDQLKAIASSQVDYSLAPEYERQLNNVVISLTHSDSTLCYHDSLIRSFPNYSNIILLVPKKNSQLVSTLLKGKPYRDRVQIVPFNSELHSNGLCYAMFPDKETLIQIDLSGKERLQHCGSIWTQDLFEVAKTISGEPLIILPELHKLYHGIESKPGGDNSTAGAQSDNQYLKFLATADMQTVTLPIAFMGGNVIPDAIDGRRVVFIGSDIINATKLIWRALDEFTPDDSFVESTLKQIFAADELVVIGNPKFQQPNHLFHLDQAFTILGPGIACIENIVKSDNDPLIKHPDVISVDLFLSELRNTLLSRGYEVYSIDVTPKDVLQYKHYINAIPYTHRETGERVILMPTFPSDLVTSDREIVARNTTTFEMLGYHVIHVPTKVNQISGGIHCLVNVVN